MGTSKRQRRVEARRILRRVAANGAAFGVILALAWGAVNTPAFHARKVRLSGVVHLTREAVLEWAGIGPTTNVFRTPPGRIEERLEESPWIRDASVTRELPGTYVISIAERRPVATLRSGTGWAVVAEDAMVLDLRDRRPNGLPVVEPLAPTDASRRASGRPASARAPALAPGTRVAFTRPLVHVLAGLPASVRVVSAHRIEGGDSELRLAATGTLVRYGDPTFGARKNAALVALLRWVRGQGRVARMIDVRVPEAPALTLVPGPGAS